MACVGNIFSSFLSLRFSSVLWVSWVHHVMDSSEHCALSLEKSFHWDQLCADLRSGGMTWGSDLLATWPWASCLSSLTSHLWKRHSVVTRTEFVRVGLDMNSMFDSAVCVQPLLSTLLLLCCYDCDLGGWPMAILLIMGKSFLSELVVLQPPVHLGSYERRRIWALEPHKSMLILIFTIHWLWDLGKQLELVWAGFRPLCKLGMIILILKLKVKIRHAVCYATRTVPRIRWIFYQCCTHVSNKYLSMALCQTLN